MFGPTLETHGETAIPFSRFKYPRTCVILLWMNLNKWSGIILLVFIHMPTIILIDYVRSRNSDLSMMDNVFFPFLFLASFAGIMYMFRGHITNKYVAAKRFALLYPLFFLPSLFLFSVQELPVGLLALAFFPASAYCLTLLLVKGTPSTTIKRQGE